jgi:hypothetical protein
MHRHLLGWLWGESRSHYCGARCGLFEQGRSMSTIRNAAISIAASCALVALAPKAALADEGGVSFWVPGFFGSLAATPQTPGLSFGGIYYHTSVKAGPDVAFARQVSRGNITVPFTGNLNIDLKARADLVLGVATYVFTEKVLGAQASLSVLVPYGRSSADVSGTLTADIGPIGFTVSGSRSDAVTGFGDLVPQFALRWNQGTSNYMTYVTGNIQTGRYNQNSLANLGIGHQALDGGAGYTYFNPETGYEFSSVVGLTYNFENTHTQYKNGVDLHWDMGASRFVTKEWQIGAVGYVYQQLSCDSGAGDRVGCFKSRVVGIGPQVGHIFQVGEHHQGYLNLKGYKEFAAQARPEGFNVWLTLLISPKAPETAAPPATRRIVK